jgi:hypothetical protein
MTKKQMTKTKKRKPAFWSRLAFVLNFELLNLNSLKGSPRCGGSNFVLRASNLFLFALRFLFGSG